MFAHMERDSLLELTAKKTGGTYKPKTNTNTNTNTPPQLQVAVVIWKVAQLLQLLQLPAEEKIWKKVSNF